MDLLQVVVDTSASKLEVHSQSERVSGNSQNLPTSETSGDGQNSHPVELESHQVVKPDGGGSSTPDSNRSADTYNIILKLPESDLHNLCSLLGREGYGLFSDCFIFML